MRTQPQNSISQPSKARIYLVDDHPAFQEGFAYLLEQEPDFQVCGCAGSSQQALLEVPKLRPDLVIVDIGLGGPNGIEFIKALNAENSQYKTVVLSMHDEAIYAERALCAGAMGYIMKQAPVPEIKSAIRKVLRGERYLSTSMQNKILENLGQTKPTKQTGYFERLSDRELEIFQLIGLGTSTRQIAEQLHVSIKTVETHRAHIKEKLGLNSGLDLFRLAVEWMADQDNHRK